MTAKWGNKRLEERLREIDRNTQKREEEARRPKTIEERTSLMVEEAEMGDRAAAALAKGLQIKLKAAHEATRPVRSQTVAGGWLESSLTSSSREWMQVRFIVEVVYELMPDAYRVHVKRSDTAGTYLDAHFLVPEEAMAQFVTTKVSYDAWLYNIAKFVQAGGARPPHSRPEDAPDRFADLGLIDQTGGTDAPEPEIDQEAAIASIRRAFEEGD